MARSIYDRSNPNAQALQGWHRAQTLESFVRAVTDAEGLRLASLRPMSRLVVRTTNTLYRLVILEPRPSVLLQGGGYFPAATEVQFCGSSLGGSLLRTHWIGVGFQMELSGPAGRIVTSPVRSIEVEGDSVHGPF
jgi:hypothetical protein